MQMPCYGSLFFFIGSRRSPVLRGDGRGRRFFIGPTLSHSRKPKLSLAGEPTSARLSENC